MIKYILTFLPSRVKKKPRGIRELVGKRDVARTRNIKRTTNLIHHIQLTLHTCNIHN